MPIQGQKTTSDYMEWETMINLVLKLQRDGDYVFALIIGVGCRVGLRITDLLTLRWKDLLGKDVLVFIERKTGKTREITLHPDLISFLDVMVQKINPSMEDYLFANTNSKPYSIQHINRCLKKICKEYKIKQFIHLSALGINDAIDSEYAKSKLEGESNIQKNFSLATILRPSVVYSVDDNFTTNFMNLLNRLPFFPLYYNGDTKFTPIHCSDLTDIIYHTISNNIYSKIIECVGPEIITLKEILKKLLKLIDKNRFLIPLPLFVANLTAGLFELFPKPLLTKDQLKLLKYDNVVSKKYQTNFDIGVPSIRNFEKEVEKYSYMWREGGQFSTKKYNSTN